MINRLTADTFSRNLGAASASRQGNLARQEGARQFDKSNAMQNLLSMRGDKTARYMQQEEFGQESAMATYAARVAAEQQAREITWDREKNEMLIRHQKELNDLNTKMGMANSISNAGASVLTAGVSSIPSAAAAKK